MSNYKAGDIIKLTRLSLGMSQEELSADICAVQTLHRIENGKTRVKRSTYRKLMERMGRNGEKCFGIISVENFSLMDIMNKADTALVKHEYEKLDRYVKQLKPYLDENVVNKQYIGRKELTADYNLGRISSKEYIIGLEELLALTVKDYNSLLEKVYPFMEEEIWILVSISCGYSDQKKYDRKIAILNMLLKSLDAGYMGQKDVARIKVVLLNNLAKAYGEIDEHQKAIDIVKKSIEIAKEYKLANSLSNSYAELSWNMIQQIEKGEKSRSELELCKKYLRQGYAVAAMYENNVMKKQIHDYYKEYFQVNIYD